MWGKLQQKVAPKQQATNAGERSEENRVKSIQWIADELLCPITLALPFDPVTAEDGKVYERQAIEAHIASRDGDSLRSPATNEEMGTRLFPNHQVKSIIRKAINTCAITGDLAAAWLKLEQFAAEIESMKKAAIRGDGTAAMDLACDYYDGRKGLYENKNEANKWFKIAADCGNIFGMAEYGEHLWRNANSVTEATHGLSLLSLAAGGGADCACLYLGKIYSGKGNAESLVSVPVDKSHAIRLLERGLAAVEDGSNRWLSPKVDFYQEILRELRSETGPVDP